MRCPNQKPRKQYKQHGQPEAHETQSDSDDEENDDSDTDWLEEWDNLIESQDSARLPTH